MKKTLLALAIPAALAAASANAAINIYNANGVTVDLGGTAEVQQYKSTKDSEDATLKIDDGDLFINTTIDVAPGLKVLGGIGYYFESDGNANADVKADDLYVGFQSNFGTVTFGRQLLIADGLGNGKDYEQGLNAVGFGDTQGARVIKWYYDNGGMFYGGVSALLDSDSRTAVSGAYSYDGMVGARFAGFDTRIFAYSGNNMVRSGEFNFGLEDIQGFNFEIDYAYKVFDFSAGFGMVTYEPNITSNSEIESTTWHLAAGYQADTRTYFAAGAYFLDSSAKGGYAEYKGYDLYTNVTYTLHNNAKMYAEIAISDLEIGGIEQPYKDLGYVMGMEVSF